MDAVEEALYLKYFDRREVGALRSEVVHLNTAVELHEGRTVELERSLHRANLLNNFVFVAFLGAALFAGSFYFLFVQEQLRANRLLNEAYTAQVYRDKAQFRLAKTQEHLHWLEAITTFTPTVAANWWVENFEVTAYTNSPDEVAPYYDGFTATMTPADWRRNIVAVDPKVVPLRSSMFIHGRGWVRAEDTGGAIKGKRIDVLVETKDDAFKYGRQHNIPVIVIPPDGVKRHEIAEIDLPIPPKPKTPIVVAQAAPWYRKIWESVKP